jgi:hypothetical protein
MTTAIAPRVEAAAPQTTTYEPPAAHEVGSSAPTGACSALADAQGGIQSLADARGAASHARSRRWTTVGWEMTCP